MKRRYLLLIIPTLLACSFFEPRDPADPDPGEGIPWQQPYSPATVVINLMNAMEGRSISITMDCCDSTYQFIADGADTADFGAQWNFSNWDYDVEQGVMMNIYNTVQDTTVSEDSIVYVTMSMTNIDDPTSPSDTVEIWRDYEIVLAGSEYCDWGHPAKGRIKFVMIEDTYGLWSILTCYDYRPDDYTGEFYTWGVVKATYR